MSMFKSRWFAATGLAIAASWGCHGPGPASGPPPADEHEEVTEVEASAIIGDIESVDARKTERTVIGHSVEDRDIPCYAIGETGPVVLIIGGIHGSEPAAAKLAWQLIAYLDEHPDIADGRRILIVPEANPDGVAHGTRHNVHGVDINRNFPADNWRTAHRYGKEPLCEPESLALHDLLQRYPPARVVSIHQPLAVIDYDGPAEPLAQAMAGQCDLPVKKLGTRPGSLGAYVGETMNTPIVTLELPEFAHRMDEDERWTRYGPALLQAIRGISDATTTSPASPTTSP